MRSTTADGPAWGAGAAVTAHRRRLGLDEGPLEVLRRFRDRDRPVALVGAWHQGDALVACDPVRVLDPDVDDPFDLPLPDVAPRASADGSAGFGGGWIGLWGYRLGGRLERVPPARARPVEQPDARLAFYAWVLRRSRGTWWLEWLGDLDVAPVLAALEGPAPEPVAHHVGPLRLVPSTDEHVAAVARAVEHVHAGDLFQVNLCARLEGEVQGHPVDVFCAGAQRLRPAYGAFVGGPADSGEGVASFSPELFLRRTGHEVLTSPIKGTAPLGVGPQDDAAAAETLAASAKDRAENVMIVDLMRNDLGRVCATGSVRVPALVRPERHAVWQLVSDVVGRLAPDVDDADLWRATFPPGSVTGAPKVRAREVAAALEATGREAYTGAIGHVSPLAGLEANVVIRTVEMARGRAWLGVGGGIVADSDPQAELAEVFVKARPVVEAVGGTLVDDVPRPAPAVSAPHRSAGDWSADVGRGVFTTLLVDDGRAVDVASHLARLDASVRAVYGSSVREGLDDAVARRAASLPPGRHRLRVEAVPLEPPGDADDHAVPVRVRLVDAPLAPAPASWRLVPREVPGGWGSHKWVDRGPLEPPAGADELLLVDVDGSVLEGGRTSVFCVLDDGVHTPPLDGRVLPGTQRARVVDALLRAGVPLRQRRLTRSDLVAASEVFVTNALRGVVPVHEVEGVGTWAAPGPLTTLLSTSLASPHPHDRDVSGPDPGFSPRERHGQRGRGRAARVLFVDNYDSFVFNLVQYVRELGADADVVRNDEVGVEQLLAARSAGDLTHVVLSPGPGAPSDAGISVDVVRRLGPTTPLLGVCLGHQAIAEAYGARVVRAPQVVHGKPSLVHHDGLGLHAGLPTPLVVARYHSLVAEEASLPTDLVVTSRTASGVVMGLRHATHPVEGVQWHPESILTSHGHDLLATFLDA
ncbi:chorismate-binding protein [Aeromicrobium sp.]|uniref:chorismate-binding protein n=1 Tax=Aeromicrobium sp. TaxID=1871063 RepID=UPI003513F123